MATMAISPRSWGQGLMQEGWWLQPLFVLVGGFCLPLEEAVVTMHEGFLGGLSCVALILDYQLSVRLVSVVYSLQGRIASLGCCRLKDSFVGRGS